MSQLEQEALTLSEHLVSFLFIEKINIDLSKFDMSLFSIIIMSDGNLS